MIVKYSESYHLHIYSQLSQCWSLWTRRGRTLAFAAPGPCRRHFAVIHSVSWHCECHLSGCSLDVSPFCPIRGRMQVVGELGDERFGLHDKDLPHTRAVIKFSWGLHAVLQVTTIPSHWQGAGIWLSTFCA